MLLVVLQQQEVIHEIIIDEEIRINHLVIGSNSILKINQ